MTDQAARASARPVLVVSLTAGAVSGLFYSSLLLSAVFLVPAQIAFGRAGRAAGAGAAGVSAVVIAISLGLWMGRAGLFDPVALVTGIAVPVVLLGALILMNARFWDDRPEHYRLIAAAAIGALALAAVLVGIERNLVSAELIEKLFSAVSPATGVEGYEATATVAGVEAKEFAGQLMAVMVNSCAASIFMILGGSWRIGNRLSGPDSLGRERTCPIDDFRLPNAMIWIFLASWSAVAAAILLKVPQALSAIAWNAAIAAAMAYAAQGLGVATQLLKRWNMPRPLRIAMAATFALALMTPTAGTAVAVAVALLGITETWIPYRNPKGVGA